MNVVEMFYNATESMSTVIENLPKRIEELNKLVSKCDGELNDLTHLAELENFNAAEGYFIAKQIQKATRKRRSAKDELDMLFAIKSIANNNSKFDAHLLGLKKQFNEVTKKKSSRTYNVRVRTDLRERFAKCSK